MRREWIEMQIPPALPWTCKWSPSMRREWIEMECTCLATVLEPCLPPCGGSGLKCHRLSLSHVTLVSLPPCGGSGLKCPQQKSQRDLLTSPSMRREWIEIYYFPVDISIIVSPSMRREWIEIPSPRSSASASARLPPCGGSGLK